MPAQYPQQVIIRGERRITHQATHESWEMAALTLDGYKTELSDGLAFAIACLPKNARWRAPPRFDVYTDWGTDCRVVRVYARGWLPDEPTTGGIEFIEV